MDLQKLFEAAKKYEKAKAAPSEKSERVVDERMLTMKAGNTYRCRLVYRLSKDSDRKLPFISKKIHNSYGVEVPAGTQNWLVCPTSEHIKGNAGFKDCPICTDLSKWYKEKAASPISSKLYETFKRVAVNHAVVYVVSDPVNPENNGKMKIIKFATNVADFLKWEVYGINLKDTSLLNEDAIGAKAFDFNDGHDIIFTVAKDKYRTLAGKEVEYDKPTASFSRKTTKIDISDDDLQEMFDALNFDKDFYCKPTQLEILNWYNTVVLKNMVATSSDNNKIDVESSEDVSDEEVVVETKPIPQPVKKPTPTPKPVVSEQSVKQKPKVDVKQEVQPTKVEDVDLDDIMGIIDSIGN